MPKQLPFGLLWFPGMRATAYLNILKQLDVFPSVIICLKNDRSKIDGLSQEATQNGYNEQYFNLDYKLDDYLQEFNVPVVQTNATNINVQEVADILQRQQEKNWIFCGGGILKSHLFTDGLQFLHIHPGKLPSYKGSTCFYYSLLKNMTLSSSAFYLSPKLDDGEVILTTNFKVNICITEKNKLFIDHVLDPWIRAISLKRVLLKIMAGQSITTTSYPESATRAYYVMHPLLRCLTVNSINRHNNPLEANSISIVE